MYNNPYQNFNSMARFQPMTSMPTIEQPIQQNYISPMQPNKFASLLGKSVDSIETAKVMEYQLDGSTSYFPLTDGSAIVTKQLQSDGTSKTIVYKPVEEEKANKPSYITREDLQKSLDELEMPNIDDLKEEIKDLKRELRELKETKKGK